jgi:hypothetical protein
MLPQIQMHYMMKKIIALLFGLYISCFSYSQSYKSDSTYFILGTLEDYIGRTYVSDSAQLDHYWGLDGEVVYIIDSILRKMHYEPISDTVKPSIRCIEIAREVNSFYSNGRLKDSIFSNDNERYLFLAGAYFRHGHRTDSLYLIRMSNSVSKWNLCFKTIKDIGCDSVSVKHVSGIPGSSTVYFKPTKALLMYFDAVEPLRLTVRNYVNDYMKKKLGKENYNEYIREMGEK